MHYRNVLKHQIITIFTSTSIYTDNHTSIFTLKADCPRVFLLDDPLPHPARLLHLQDEDVAADADLDTGISIKLGTDTGPHIARQQAVTLVHNLAVSILRGFLPYKLNNLQQLSVKYYPNDRYAE